jgi:gentisate 1,2-dioxygenase
MTSATQDTIANVGSLDELYRELAPLRLNPGWNKPEPAMWPMPRTSYVPTHWKYSRAKVALDAAGRLINTELAERRNLILVNPVQGNNYAIARTMVSAYQMIMPGERARSHRHMPNALRLVLDAEPGAYTIVNGEKLSMGPNDVVLTPGWSWHGHGNEGKGCAYWLDYLDVPLVQVLEPMFFEQHPEGFETGAVEKLDSPMLFSWKDTCRRLAEAKNDAGGPFGTQIKLETPSIPTLGLSMMRLDAGVTTAPCKMTANNIYSVAEGSGVTISGNERFEWRRGDVVVIPLWQEHSHKANESSVLFRVTDAQLMERLGFLRAGE